MTVKKDKSSIMAMFDSIASDYDKLNDIMSLKQNQKLKKRAVNKIKVKKGYKILDLCTGTGDIAIDFAQKYGTEVEIYAVDFSKNMLSIANKRFEKYPQIKSFEADVLNLPFENEYFDVCFISYGLRNLENLDKGLSEIYRVLKKSGTFSSLDLGKPNKFINIFFKPYFYKLIPLFGMFFHGDKSAYQYLPKSNETFPSPDNLLKILVAKGFKNPNNYNYLFGTIAQQIVEK